MLCYSMALVIPSDFDWGLEVYYNFETEPLYIFKLYSFFTSVFFKYLRVY